MICIVATYNGSSQEWDYKLAADVQVVFVGGFGKENCYCL